MLHAVLSATVERRGHDQTRIAPRVGMVVAILMRERNQFMCAAQTLVSIVLHASLPERWYVMVSNMFGGF